MEPMQLTLASQDDFLLVTAAGPVSVKEVLHLFKTVIDTAKERGFDKILMDFLAVTGELSPTDLHEVGSTMAKYCANQSIYPKVAVIGKPPTVTGFGAEVASNRGLTSRTFSESSPALKWLRAFASRTSGA